VTLDAYVFPDPSRVDTPVQASVAAVREFVRRFPAIFEERYRERYQADPEKYGIHNWDRVSVELHQFSGIEVEGVESDLLAIAGRVAPDVLYVNFRKSHTYIDQGFLYPLDRPEDHYLAAMTEDEKAFRIHPKIWPVIHRKGRGGDKHVWAMPFGGALGKVLLYRKDLFDEKGVAYPDEHWTWDDLYQACRKLTDHERGIYGIRFVRAKHESYHWVTFLWSAGGDVLAYDEATDTWSVVFDSDAAVDALDFYTRLSAEPWTDAAGKLRRGYAFKDPSDGLVKWQRGEIAMMFDNIDERLFSVINPDVTGMAPVPKGPRGQRGAELNSRMMGLFSEIADPAVRDAAWEYMRFFDSRDAAGIKTRIMVEGGLGRFVNPRYLRMFGYPAVIRLAPKGWESIYETAIATGIPEPYGKHSNIAYDILTEPLHAAEQLERRDQLPADPGRRRAVLAGLLDEAAAKARVQMLGEVPPRELKRQRIGAALFLVAVALVFTLGLRRVARAFTPPGSGPGPRGWGVRRYAAAYVLMLPALLTILVWAYVPLLRGLVMGFQDYRILGASTWVGLDNFGQVLWSHDWWASVWNAFRYSLLVMACTFLPPVVLAILLQEVPRGKILFRTIYYLPAVMTGLVVILLWKSFYDPGESGVLNTLVMRIPAFAFVGAGAALCAGAWAFARRLHYHGSLGWTLFAVAVGAGLFGGCFGFARPMLTAAGLPLLDRLVMTLPEPIDWTGNPATAMAACVVPMAWAGMGPGCLIYLAALKGIPEELYEAADMAGATFIDKVMFIVFPMLKPLLVINFVGVFIGSWFFATANILAMTGGVGNTEIAGLHIFYQAFIYLRFGPATAMAWVLGFMLIGFTVYQLRILSRLEFRTTGEK
jgi:multiple sugar transport system permease protein